MRGQRGRFLSVAVVVAAVGGVAVAFPFDAISFRPAAPKAGKPCFAAFVSLGEAEEAAAMKAAKSSWNAKAGGVRSMRAELFPDELPEAEKEPALEIADRLGRSVDRPVSPSLSPYLPSLAAPPPKAIPVEKADAGAAPQFPREELLKMD